MSTIYKCDRCGKEMNKKHASLREIYIDSKNNQNHETLDLCEECYKDFKYFMIGPGFYDTCERDLDSKTPLSEVKEPPNIHGCGQCEFNYTSVNDEPCASCGFGNSNFKPKGFYNTCEQCKFKDFAWDEEPCSTCKYSVMSIGDDPSDNFEIKEEDSRYSTDANTGLSKAKYKLGSYIQSDIIKGSIYKIMDIRLRDDDEIVYKVEDLSSGIQNLLWERVIDNYYTVIVKYSCDGCKLEGTDDRMCDTCIVGDPKGPRRQWWKPKEEDK